MLEILEACRVPLVFIHGVNTRDTDRDYFIVKAARKKLFTDLVVAGMLDLFPRFTVLDDIYWGDLGVKFRWGLRTVPQTQLFESLGADSIERENAALLQVMAGTGSSPDGAEIPDAGDFETLGSSADPPLLGKAVSRLAASRRAGDLVRAVFAPEGELYAPDAPGHPANSASQTELQSLGEQLALLLRAVQQVSAAADQDARLLDASSDNLVLDKIRDLVAQSYAQLLAGSGGEPVDADEFEALGGVGSPMQWAVKRLADWVEAAKGVVANVRGKPTRAATLLALERYRNQVTRSGLRFFGDVLVYLREGVQGEIAKRVQEGVRKAWDVALTNGEPLLVITHSFGSALLYDLLTGGRLDDIQIALWASAGAQTSLFAEMALFNSSDPDLPNRARPLLGKPSQVKKWINFFDDADVLSYLHEPVYGSRAVTDIAVREVGNLTTAHGHYFLTSSFYERIGGELAATYL